MKRLLQTWLKVWVLILPLMFFVLPVQNATASNTQVISKHHINKKACGTRCKKAKKSKKRKQYAKKTKKKRYKKKHSKKRYSKKRYNKRYKKARYKKKRSKKRYSKKYYTKVCSKKKNSKKRSCYYKKKRRVKSKKRRVLTCDMLSRSTLLKKARPFNKAIHSASSKYGVDPNLIRAIITVETCFRPKARGALGEKGLMQLMPATGREYGLKNGYNSWDNIHAGTRFLRRLQKYYGKNRRSYIAAAYNGGIGNVSRTRGPKIQAVRRYSKKVMNAYSKFATYKGKKAPRRKAAKNRPTHLASN